MNWHSFIDLMFIDFVISLGDDFYTLTKGGRTTLNLKHMHLYAAKTSSSLNWNPPLLVFSFTIVQVFLPFCLAVNPPLQVYTLYLNSLHLPHLWVLDLFLFLFIVCVTLSIIGSSSNKSLQVPQLKCKSYVYEVSSQTFSLSLDYNSF